MCIRAAQFQQATPCCTVTVVIVARSLHSCTSTGFLLFTSSCILQARELMCIRDNVTSQTQARFTSIILSCGNGFVKPEGIVFGELYIEDKSRDLFIRKADRSQQPTAASSTGIDDSVATATDTSDTTAAATIHVKKSNTAAATAEAASDVTSSNSTNGTVKHPNGVGSNTAAAVEHPALHLDHLHISDSGNSNKYAEAVGNTASGTDSSTLQPRRVKLGYIVTYSNAGTDRALSSGTAVALQLQCRSQLETELGITYL
jgi:hypothetical protein